MVTNFKMVGHEFSTYGTDNNYYRPSGMYIECSIHRPTCFTAEQTVVISRTNCRCVKMSVAKKRDLITEKIRTSFTKNEQ